MMENIEFRYCFEENGETKEVTISKEDESGFHDYDVCELFLDFMVSIGFSEENVCRYFSEDE